ncbi:MAG: putative ABC transporter ATP-binding protein [candidate division BRC1 bacterium ADurb.BinA292]|nr:MAG: putative ABC transporter ATP-binding protein [candidate division BRC1 bacterium ADurb.BinA292]
MIRFEHVVKRLGGRVILDDLSFEIAKGEVFVIVGPSGTGKSVTLKHMVRLMSPTSGTVWLGDQAISRADGAALQRLRERFGYLFQGGALLGWMTVAENVALPLEEKTGMAPGAIDARVAEVLEMVGLEADGGKLPAEISGGMQKRAGLARAIVRNPEIVLYDEPTSGLDPVTSRTIDRLIKHLNATLGVTSVVVTHDLHSALSIGHRIAMLYQGRIVELAGPEAFIESRDPEVRQFLEAQFITKTWRKDGRV